MKIKITFSKHLRVFSFHILSTILALICLMYYKFEEIPLLVFGIIWVLYTIPALYLHFEYLFYNSGQQFDLNQNGLTIYYKGEEKHYKKEIFESLTIIMMPSKYLGSSIQYLAIESYHYAILKLKNGEKIIITCLLSPDVEKAISILNFPYQRKKNLFCSIELNKRINLNLAI
jgi:hypothetical protein